MAGGRRSKIPRKVEKARSGKYKFSDKKHPVQGIVSFAIGMAAFLMVFFGIFLSERAKGQGGAVVGLLGIAALISSAVGLCLALSSLKKKEIHYRFPAMGGLLNGVLLLFLLLLYVMGAAVM